MFAVTLTDRPARRVPGLIHRGPCGRINAAHAQVNEIPGAAGLWPRFREMVAVYFDDPDTVPAAQLRSLAGVVLAPGTPLPQGLEAHELPGGRHAVRAFKGPSPGLTAACGWFHGDWLRAGGAALRDAPAFEVYRNSPMDTAPEDLRTDIDLPLVGDGAG